MCKNEIPGNYLDTFLGDKSVGKDICRACQLLDGKHPHEEKKIASVIQTHGKACPFYSSGTNPTKCPEFK